MLTGEKHIGNLEYALFVYVTTITKHFLYSEYNTCFGNNVTFHGKCGNMF